MGSSVGSSTVGSLNGPRGVWSSLVDEDRQLHEDHHSNDRERVVGSADD